MTASDQLIAAVCPTGKLRASINLGNPLLASLDAAGNAVGVSIDIAHELARQLQVGVELAVFKKAAQSVEALSAQQADIGFFAIDPLRGAEIAFTAPYLLIEGYFLVQANSAIKSNEDVDQPGNRVVVGAGSAYDLYLTRELKRATIIRAASSQDVIKTFLELGAEVAAGVKQQLQADLQPHTGLRLLDQRFMTIQQAMGLPKTRGVEAAQYLVAFVEQIKRSGFVVEALQRHGISGVTIAPATA